MITDAGWKHKRRALRAQMKETGGTISERLRLTRYTRQQTIREVADKSGIPFRTIQRWEDKGADGAGVFLIGCLAQYYGVSLDWLVFGKEDA